MTAAVLHPAGGAAAAPTEALRWIAKHTVHLHTPEAGHGFTDMEPLRPLIGNARLVMLGEATHGTREFFQLKHRLLEFLVTEMGFSVFGIEGNLPEAIAVNRYVLSGEGDPVRVLGGLVFWTWYTEELLDLIRWMRAYNADPSHERKVSFHGFDMQFGSRAGRDVRAYLERVGWHLEPAQQAALDVLSNPFLTSNFLSLPEPLRRSAVATAAEILPLLEHGRDNLVARSSAGEWALACREARVLQQFVGEQLAYLDEPPADDADQPQLRDVSMAENIRWILEQEGPDAKMVVWAHNEHVTRGRMEGRQWMGHCLSQAANLDLVIMGMAFNRGAFRAKDGAAPGSGYPIRDFTVNPLPAGSLDETLARAGLQLGVLDLRRLPPDGPVAAWFDTPHLTRCIGGGYSEEAEAEGWMDLAVRDHYDALLFVETTTTSRGIPYVNRSPSASPGQAVNLDFETGDIDQIPPGWLVHPAPMAEGNYRASVTADRPYRGQRCAVIASQPGPPCGEFEGLLRQRIDAAPYHGKQLRMTAAVRVEPTGRHSQAYLWLRVLGASTPANPMGFIDMMADRPITHADWKVHEIVGDIPREAKMIEFGLTFVGEGRAWLDAVELEALGAQDEVPAATDAA